MKKRKNLCEKRKKKLWSKKKARQKEGGKGGVET